MRREEELVAALVEAVLPSVSMRPVEEQSAGQWDYDLVTQAETFPFEVTRFTSAPRNRLYKAILGKQSDDAWIPRQVCKKDWWIHPSHIADIRRVRKGIDGMLAEVESLGLREFDINGVGSDTEPVRALWNELRIESGCQMDWNPTGFIALSLPGESAMLCADHVFDAASHVMNKADNRKKLGASPASERHLGVFIDELGYPAQASMQYGYFPSEPLVLPGEITHVWLFTWVAHPAKYCVWRYASREGWRDLGVHSGVRPDAGPT